MQQVFVCRKCGAQIINVDREHHQTLQKDARCIICGGSEFKKNLW